MAHFAKIENGIVTNVLVVANEHESYGQEYLNGLGLEGTWVQTSYSGSVRKKFAGIGDEYLADKDAFRPPAPYPSWVFDFKKWEWKAPKPYPTDGEVYNWDEDAGEWVLVETEA